jgi:lipopolysaccharide export LptBFGC system permease protein LptF
MEYYGSFISFCSGGASKHAVVALSISLVITLCLFYLLTNLFAYAEARQQERQEYLLRDTLVRSTSTAIELTKQNQSLVQSVPDPKYDYNRSSLKFFNTELGTETKNINNWVTINHDIYGTRSSNQTVIKKDNIGTLQVKWRLTNDVEIQDPP